MSAAVGIAIQRIGRARPPRRASRPFCMASKLRFAARAARLPKNGMTAGETTVTPSGVERAKRAYERSFRAMRGNKSLFDMFGRPFEQRLVAAHCAEAAFVRSFRAFYSRRCHGCFAHRNRVYKEHAIAGF